MPEGLQGFFAKTNFSLSACFLSLAPSERKKERQGGREGERGKGKEREREREREREILYSAQLVSQIHEVEFLKCLSTFTPCEGTKQLLQL
jgi:hypothetical protein